MPPCKPGCKHSFSVYVAWIDNDLPLLDGSADGYDLLQTPDRGAWSAPDPSDWLISVKGARVGVAGAVSTPVTIPEVMKGDHAAGVPIALRFGEVGHQSTRVVDVGRGWQRHAFGASPVIGFPSKPSIVVPGQVWPPNPPAEVYTAHVARIWVSGVQTCPRPAEEGLVLTVAKDLVLGAKNTIAIPPGAERVRVMQEDDGTTLGAFDFEDLQGEQIAVVNDAGQRFTPWVDIPGDAAVLAFNPAADAGPTIKVLFEVRL